MTLLLSNHSYRKADVLDLNSSSGSINIGQASTKNLRKNYEPEILKKDRDLSAGATLSSTSKSLEINSKSSSRNGNQLQPLPPVNLKKKLKEKENNIPSYLRGTASSLLKAVDHSNNNHNANNHHNTILVASKKSTTNSSSTLKKSISFKFSLDNNAPKNPTRKSIKLSGSVSSSNLLSKNGPNDTHYSHSKADTDISKLIHVGKLSTIKLPSLKSNNEEYVLQKLPTVKVTNSELAATNIADSKYYRSVSDSAANSQHLSKSVNNNIQRTEKRIMSNNFGSDKSNTNKNKQSFSFVSDNLSHKSSSITSNGLSNSTSKISIVENCTKPMISSSTSTKQICLTKKQICLLNKHATSTTENSSSLLPEKTSKSSFLSFASFSHISTQNSSVPTIRKVSNVNLNKNLKESLNKGILPKNKNALSITKSATSENLSKKISTNKRSINKSNSSYSSSFFSSLIDQQRNHSNSHLKPKVQKFSELLFFLQTSPDTAKIIIDETSQNLSKVKKPSISVKDLLFNNDKDNRKFRRLDFYETNELSRRTKEIYFLGDRQSKVEISNMKNNLGLDDNNQNYIVEIGDHIDYRYEVLQFLGIGNFGKVLKCKDHKNGEVVAVKIIKNDFKWSLQAMYEIKILKELLSEGDNDSHILKYLDHYNFRSHMCITTELLSITLFQCLEATKFSGFCIPILMSWSKQILSALKFIHSHNIIHCDLKPENIMLQNFSSNIITSGTYCLDIKIIDFGSSCHVNELSYTYIQSRFYRAPEVILGAYYDTKIDIWSLGCILAELYSGGPLIESKNEVNHLELLIQFFGVPSKSMILQMREQLKKKGPIGSNNKEKTKAQFMDDYLATHLNKQFDKYGNYSPRRVTSYSTAGSTGAKYSIKQESGSASIQDHSNNSLARKSLSSILFKGLLSTARQGNLERLFMDFLLKALVWNPNDRCSAIELLDCDFLKYYDDHCTFLELNISK